MAHKLDKELQEYKNLMEVPSHFDDGFTLSAFFGAIFIAIVMIPGAVYMQLIAGVGIGAAAQWVTVILFIELAKRANATLKKAEIFILFYMAGAVISSGNIDLIFRQFMVRSGMVCAFQRGGTAPYLHSGSVAAGFGYDAVHRYHRTCGRNDPGVRSFPYDQ